MEGSHRFSYSIITLVDCERIGISCREEILIIRVIIRIVIPRLMENLIFTRLMSLHKAILLLGARQVGKTTLLGSLQARLSQEGNNERNKEKQTKPNCSSIVCPGTIPLPNDLLH